MMSDYEKRLEAYQMATAIARSILSKGMISDKDYERVKELIAKKYGLSESSIFR